MSAINLREIRAAQILYFMDRFDEAKSAADAGVFRLQGLRTQLGDDYRIDLAEAMLSPILDETASKVRARVTKVKASRPDDKIEQFRFILEFARIYAMAGLATDSIEILEPLFSPPSETSVFTVSLDPAFDSIRDDPDFVAMIERHR